MGEEANVSLKQEEVKLAAARKALKEAIESPDKSANKIKQLKLAINTATSLGLTDEELEEANVSLKLEEEATAARKALKEAVESPNGGFAKMHELRSAINMGEDVGLQGEELEEAKQSLQKEEKAKIEGVLTSVVVGIFACAHTDE